MHATGWAARRLRPERYPDYQRLCLELWPETCARRRYYGLLAQRFALIGAAYRECLEEAFRRQYALIHRLETNKLRNVARFFGHLLASDAISWAVLDHIRLTEDDTTSSSRIFIKHLFQARLRMRAPACIHAH
jgi:pre-mRNA-splicing factor CWC22